MNALLGLLILLVTPLVPLALACALLLKPESNLLRTVAAWAALPALITSWLMVPGIAATVPWLLQGSEFGLDTISRQFLFFSSAIWLIAGVFALAWFDQRDQKLRAENYNSRFFALFLFTMSGNLGLIIARDVLSFYLFFCLMSFAAFGLILHNRNQGARFAGRVYMAFVMAGDMCLLVAVLLMAQDTRGLLLFEAVRGSLEQAPNRDLVIVLLLIGFGIKAGLIGLHVTLPLIYRAAPLPAVLVLAGAMLNAGLLGWLRMLPFGIQGLDDWGHTIAIVGCVAAFAAALIALRQSHWRAVLAYSSISQISIILTAIGLALAQPAMAEEIMVVITFYAFHHALAKTALFMAGALVRRSDGEQWSYYFGIAALILPACAIAATPFTSGMLAKEALKHVLTNATPEWAATVKMLLPWMSVATTLILARFIFLVWPRTHSISTSTMNRSLILPWVALLFLSMLSPWLLSIRPDIDWWNAHSLWSVSWPVLFGTLLSAIAVYFHRLGKFMKLPVIPPGDWLVLLLALGNTTIRLWLHVAHRYAPQLRSAGSRVSEHVSDGANWSLLFSRAEEKLSEWCFAMTLLPLMALLLIAAIALS